MDKTTKEILEEKIKDSKRTQFYNPEALQSINDTIENWKDTKVREADRKNWEVIPQTILGSKIPRNLFYSPLDVKDSDYLEDLGYPGEVPFTRGIHANMYRGRSFTRRQLSGAGSPEYVNKRIKMLLDHGATGINLALDLPTVQMFDSDEPESRGHVGVVGVPVDCVEDMEEIFKDIPIDKISASVVTHFPRNTAIIFPMYLIMAERRGIPWNQLEGSVQNDFIMESVVRNGPEFISPKDTFKLQCDNIEFIRQNVPRWNYVTLNGYNLREFGTSGITEMAVAIANAIESIEEMIRRGHEVDWVAERVAFFWAPANDFFEEVARLRAVRRLWYRIMKYRFNAQNPRSMWMRCHVQTSGISLMREEPMNNVIRAAYHALAAILGGAQSLHVDSYDEAYSVPTEESSLLSLRTQQIIEAETAVTQVVDPLGGSFYLETLTNQVEKAILDEIDEIEKMGGLSQYVEKGWLQKKVSEFIHSEQDMIEKGEIKIVGRNYYRASDTKLPDIRVPDNPEGLEEKMKAKLDRIRRERDNDKVARCLKDIKEACEKGENVTYRTLEAARANATKGEMRRAIVEGFGPWRSGLIV
jgi:methylmalonyl-CoA mutase N-terminal domain/subunit